MGGGEGGSGDRWYSGQSSRMAGELGAGDGSEPDDDSETGETGGAGHADRAGGNGEAGRGGETGRAGAGEETATAGACEETATAGAAEAETATAGGLRCAKCAFVNSAERRSPSTAIRIASSVHWPLWW